MSEEKKEKKEERIIEISGKDFSFKLTRLEGDISIDFNLSKEAWNRIKEFFRLKKEEKEEKEEEGEEIGIGIEE